VPGGEPQGEWLEYARRHASVHPEEVDVWLELPVRARWMVDAIADSLTSGELIVIDYGYTRREAIRFPRGTLLSYQRHRAVDDVLVNPGLQDITAHVPFDFIRDCAALAGLRERSFETLTQWALRAGEPDSFAAVLAAPSEEAAAQRRLQLKSLLFGMGETFRVLTMEKG
jgi:SAM-dependent MidA family methyltransferase